GIVDGKDGTREAVRSREGGHGTFDHIGKERDKQSAEQRPEQAAHPADDDHGNVLDRELEGESLDRYEAAVIGEERPRHRRYGRRDDEGEQLVAGGADAECFGHGLVGMDRAAGTAGAAAASSTKYETRGA